MGNIGVRKAELSDLDFILSELEQFSKFYGTEKSLFPKKESAEEFIKSLIQNHLFLVSHTDEELTGFISGFLGQHPYNNDITTLTETFWWVKESHRNSSAGARLLKAYTQIGREVADWVIMTLEHKSPVKDESIIKRGFKPIEKTFLMEVNRGAVRA